jgi:hypothetical protein
MVDPGGDASCRSARDECAAGSLAVNKHLETANAGGLHVSQYLQFPCKLKVPEPMQGICSFVANGPFFSILQDG